jgi:hypothetical protein
MSVSIVHATHQLPRSRISEGLTLSTWTGFGRIRSSNSVTRTIDTDDENECGVCGLCLCGLVVSGMHTQAQLGLAYAVARAARMRQVL